MIINVDDFVEIVMRGHYFQGSRGKVTEIKGDYLTIVLTTRQQLHMLVEQVEWRRCIEPEGDEVSDIPSSPSGS